jgi:hypothetical protein
MLGAAFTSAAPSEALGLLPPTCGKQFVGSRMRKSPESTSFDNRLLAALDALETAIESAKGAATANTAHQGTVARLECYSSMVEKQRVLVSEMIAHRARGNWDEFKRHANLLSGTSNMIQLDVISILADLSGRSGPSVRQE